VTRRPSCRGEKKEDIEWEALPLVIERKGKNQENGVYQKKVKTKKRMSIQREDETGRGSSVF